MSRLGCNCGRDHVAWSRSNEMLCKVAIEFAQSLARRASDIARRNTTSLNLNRSSEVHEADLVQHLMTVCMP